jgi:hypothetical protein
MPVASHIKAAADHEAACKCHTAAADLHAKAEHTAAVAKSDEATSCCGAAVKSTTQAQAKSSKAART